MDQFLAVILWACNIKALFSLLKQVYHKAFLVYHMHAIGGLQYQFILEGLIFFSKGFFAHYAFFVFLLLAERLEVVIFSLPWQLLLHHAAISLLLPWLLLLHHAAISFLLPWFLLLHHTAISLLLPRFLLLHHTTISFDFFVHYHIFLSYP
jgi:hypothetical protein